MLQFLVSALSPLRSRLSGEACAPLSWVAGVKPTRCVMVSISTEKRHFVNGQEPTSLGCISSCQHSIHNSMLSNHANVATAEHWGPKSLPSQHNRVPDCWLHRLLTCQSLPIKASGRFCRHQSSGQTTKIGDGCNPAQPKLSSEGGCGINYYKL